MKRHETTEVERLPSSDKLARFSVGSARSILLTLFGEFVFPGNEPVWTATLLHAFAGVGVMDKSARQALARAAAEGWIEGERDGRRTAWRLTPLARQMIVEGSRRVRALRELDSDWDGHWAVLHISLTDAQRTERQQLYRALTWLGFGSPAPGLWICPQKERVQAARDKLQALGVLDQTLALDARAFDFGVPEREWVTRAWNLEVIAQTYDDMVTRFSALRPRTDQAIFVAHIELVNALQRLPAVDPGLPSALLPKNWVAIRATERLTELRTKWRPVAHAYWASVALSS
jgi:phenylacetic acid degradation operon negative regulatory protein